MTEPSPLSAKECCPRPPLELLVLQVYSILRHVAEVLKYSKDEQLEHLYERTAWVFDKKYKRPGYGAYDAFKQAVS